MVLDYLPVPSPSSSKCRASDARDVVAKRGMIFLSKDLSNQISDGPYLLTDYENKKYKYT